jgi:hypothetical protein
MEGDETYLDSARADFFEEAGREMEARCGRRHAARGAGIDGLIPFAVLRLRGLSGDVRGEGDFAEDIQLTKNVADIREPQEAVAGGVDFLDGGGYAGRVAGGIEKDDASAKAGAAARSEHGPPEISLKFLQQEDFKAAAGLEVESAKAGGDDAGIVQDQDIAGVEEFREGLELAVLDGMGIAAGDQEARLVADGGGPGRDQSGRYVEIEVRGAQFRLHRGHVNRLLIKCG